MYANFQPFWTVPDKGLAAAEMLLGQERAKNQYPMKAMLEAGVKVHAFFYSRVLVRSIVPPLLIAFALCRWCLALTGTYLLSRPSMAYRRASRTSSCTPRPRTKLGVQTSASASNKRWRATRSDQRTQTSWRRCDGLVLPSYSVISLTLLPPQESGALFPGGAADFAVLDQDILGVPLHEIHKTKVLATYVNGELVHQGGPAPWRMRLQEPKPGEPAPSKKSQ